MLTHCLPPFYVVGLSARLKKGRAGQPTSRAGLTAHLAEHLSTEAIIGTDASAQISFLRETCIEEVVLGLENAGVPAPEMQRRGERMLRAVGLSDYCEHDPTQLSGGQTRRLAAACVAIREPEVMIVCEPAAGLDANSRTQVVRLLQELPETCVISISSVSWPELGGRIIGKARRKRMARNDEIDVDACIALVSHDLFDASECRLSRFRISGDAHTYDIALAHRRRIPAQREDIMPDARIFRNDVVVLVPYLGHARLAAAAGLNHARS